MSKIISFLVQEVVEYLRKLNSTMIMNLLNKFSQDDWKIKQRLIELGDKMRIQLARRRSS